MTLNLSPQPPRFYGRRKGRALSPRQKSLLANHLPSPSLPQWGELLTQILQSGHPLDMEIGFGQGEHLAALAQTHPERLYLGCEAFSTGVVHLLDQVVTQDLKNILVFPDDVRLLIPYIPKHSLHQVYILFADPWPKERHHKRRLVTEDFLRIIESLLKPEGRLFLASDHEGYVATMLDVLSHIPNFVWDPGFPFSCGREHRLSQPHEDDPLPPSQWPLTRYEQKALNAGLSCTYMKGHFI